MSGYILLQLLPMLALLICAAVIDLRERRIPNWLTLLLAWSGLVQSLLPTGSITLSAAVLGMLIGLALPLALFVMGALGGGDVKLLAGLGAWLGAIGVIKVFAIAAIIGMVMVVVQSARRGRLGALFRDSALVTINVMHPNAAALHGVLENSRATQPTNAVLPYAVPVFCAVVLVLVIGH
jgi:prepilin peptidase CpaA